MRIVTSVQWATFSHDGRLMTGIMTGVDGRGCCRAGNGPEKGASALVYLPYSSSTAIEAGVRTHAEPAAHGVGGGQVDAVISRVCG